MAITTLPVGRAASVASVHEASKTKIIFVTLLFLLSLATFVAQTEFTSQAYKLGYSEPIVLLLSTHGLWWLLWPIQAISVSVWRTVNKIKQLRHQRKQHQESQLQGFEDLTLNDNFAHSYQRLNSNSQLLDNQPLSAVPLPRSINTYKYFKKCIVKQIHNVYHTSILIYEANINDDRTTQNINFLLEKNPHLSNSSSITECIKTLYQAPAFKYIFLKTFLITIVITAAGLTWYAAISITYPTDVTAIYNCSAFTAYAFAIPLLNERFSWLKASSVIIAVSGVFIVAYSDGGDTAGKDAGSDKNGGDNSDTELYPYRFWGNLLISVGAILYGYYEVLYKKYTCIPAHLTKIITPRRQSTFANFIMMLLGMFTFLILFIGCLLAEILHVHHFNLFDYGENTKTIFLYIGGSVISNLLFSGSFLSMMALTSPVLSSVSSLLTIFLIGIVEWVMFGNKLSFQQLIGDVLVIVGFSILTAASWKEISEGNDDDDVETASTLSFAISTDGN